MRRIRYQVAMSLDGYIAGPNGEYDWIPMDPDLDFAALFAQFDTALVGRKTYEQMAAAGNNSPLAQFETYVFSSSLSPDNHPEITVVSENWEAQINSLKQAPGKDIWLFGGGQLFRSLLNANLVDSVEIAIVPVLLGGGLPMAPPPLSMQKLQLISQKSFDHSGIVLLEYQLQPQE